MSWLDITSLVAVSVKNCKENVSVQSAKTWRLIKGFFALYVETQIWIRKMFNVYKRGSYVRVEGFISC